MENKRDIQKEKDVFHLKTLSKTNFGVMRWWASFSLLLGLLFHSSNPSKDFYCSACLETANLRRRRHQTKMINEKKTDIKQSNAESSMQRHQIHLDWLSLHCSSHTFCLLLRFHQDFIRRSIQYLFVQLSTFSPRSAKYILWLSLHFIFPTKQINLRSCAVNLFVFSSVFYTQECSLHDKNESITSSRNCSHQIESPEKEEKLDLVFISGENEIDIFINIRLPLKLQV